MGDGPIQWSWHKAKLAMAVSGKSRHYHLKDIRRRHFQAMAARCGWGDVEPLIQAILERAPQAAAEVQAKLPAGFPENVARAVFQGLLQSTARLEAMLEDR